MSGPWEKYQATPAQAKPWEKYSAAQPDAPAKPQGADWRRELGLGARNVATGITDVLGIVGNPVNYLASKATGRPYESMSDAAGRALDSAGVPRPATSGERVGADIGRAVSGSALTMGAGSLAPVAGRVNQVLTAQPGLQALSAATGAGSAGAVRENGGGQGAQLAAGLAGGFFPGAAQYTGAAAVRGLARGGEAGRQAMESGIADFRLNGAEPSVGQATGNRRTQGLESLLSGGPTSGGVMVRHAEKQAADLGAGLRNRADNFLPNASAERAGRAVEKGVDGFVPQIKDMRGALYNKADSLVHPSTTSPLTETQATLAKLTALTPGAESTTATLINPKIAQLAQDISTDLMAARANNSGGLPYSAIKDVRSRIGAELDDFSLTTDKPTAQYKDLYKALSRDMEAAARTQGPAAEQAMHRANVYYLKSRDRLKTLEQVVDKNGGPEKVYAAVMSGTQDGGTTLRSVMQSLPPEGQKAMTAAVIKRMGLATKGQQSADGERFSAQTFLTNWNGVSKEAKRALFDRHGAKFSSDMDRISRVAERITNGSKVFANPSGTANKGLAYTYVGSVGLSAITGQPVAFASLIASGAATNITARMMTSPKFVSWLARSTELPPAALVAQAPMLAAIAKQEKDEDMAAFAESLRKTPTK